MSNSGLQALDSLLVRDSEMANRVRNFDWSSTSLGAPGIWPESLRAALGICLNSQFPMFIWWGPELINIYNDAYIPVLGKRHPHALGRSAPDVWGEIWPVLQPQMEAVMQRGEATWNERVYLKMERNGFEEDTWFTWSYSPIPDGLGGIGGLFCACTEETGYVYAEAERDRFAAHQRLAMDSARLGWWHLDPVSGDVIWDDRFKAIFGVTGDRLEYGQVITLIHPDDRERVNAAVQAATRPEDPQPYSIEYRVMHPDGSLRWVYASGQAYYTGEGPERRYSSFVGTIADITERKSVEIALQLEKVVLEQIATDRPLEEVLHTLLVGIEARSTEGMLCSLMVVDDDGKRLRSVAAPSLPGAFNMAADGVLIDSRLGPCTVAVMDRKPEFVGDLCANPAYSEFCELAGQFNLRSCSSTPVFGADGSVLAAMAIYYREAKVPSERDLELIRSAIHFTGIVIERKRTERKVREALEAERRARSEAERVSLMKDEFLTTLSHELRTPLNAMLGWSQLLRSNNLDTESRRQAVDTIERNARAQKQLIEDLLDMGRIVSGKVRLDVQRIDLQDVVEAAIDSVQPTAAAKGIRLEKVIDPNAGPVSGDAARLQQVLWNLLTNAIKFTPRGGKIQVTLERVNSHLELSVSDTGVGIPREFLPHVFDRFTQADGAITRQHGGLGLGLSIVKHIVEMHNGTVRATSPGEDRGTTFLVNLPLAIFQLEKDEDRQHPGSADGLSPATIDAPSLSGLKVLVLDDEADARELVQYLLETRGAVVFTAGSALNALELVRREQPDVIVSDIGMPEVDGYEFIRRVRALDKAHGGATPAIALTAFARSEDRRRALLSGFQSYVSKPMEAAELLAVIASVSGRVQA